MEVRFVPSAKLAFWWTLRFAGEPFLRLCTPLPQWGLDVMSESHCTNPTGGLLIRPKHKKNYIRLLVLFPPVSYAMPMRPNKAETAVHGCHYLGDIAVRMPDRGLVFERATCFYCSKRVTFVVDCVNSHNKNRMTHPLRVAKNWTTHPLPRVQKLMTPLPLCSGPPPPPPPPPPYFLTSPLVQQFH